MAEYGELVDAFAEARRTWDDLVMLQPDIIAASRVLTPADLVELGRRVAAHRRSLDQLGEAIDTAGIDSFSRR